MRIAITIYLAICIEFGFSQNLVPNPSFEKYFECPATYNAQGSNRNFAPGWTSPTQGTPDLFNRCSFGNAGVPHNWAGVAHAHSGWGYSGIYAYINNSDYREYLQAKLTKPMTPGRKYKVEFYFRLSVYSKYSIDRIGVLLSDSLQQVPHDNIWTVKPSFNYVMDSVYSMKTGLWNHVQFNYVAQGGEQFINIGNFSPEVEVKKFHLSFSKATEPLLSKAAYFYIDDVSVVPLDDVVPKIDSTELTVKKVLKPNETYILKHIYFSFNSYDLEPISYEELNFLVAVLKKNPSWYVELSGHTDDKGNNLYNYHLSLNRAKSVGRFLAGNGIAVSRISTKGYGKLKPLSKARTEEARSINRRVEVKFSEKKKP
ncbi:MAG: OmpA family protein [Bacteroidetes bacterium]|nr:OmpA family protein [Bacteroidota bacterium]